MRRNKNEKKQKMCATLENTWFWIVCEKIQKNKKRLALLPRIGYTKRAVTDSNEARGCRRE